MLNSNIKIHPTSEVHKDAVIGDLTQIWNNAQVREGALIGARCVIGKEVYIDKGVKIGNDVKIQNGVSVYQGVIIEDGVFCGPNCVFTNDKTPRAINPDGKQKKEIDWKISPTIVCYGASIGANSTIVCGVTIGRWAMIGAGAVVTKDVGPHQIKAGNPAVHLGYSCKCGAKLVESNKLVFDCMRCGSKFHLREFE